MELKSNETPCSDGCPGWLHFNEPYEIEKCDECGRFKSDEEAVIAHRVECKKHCLWPEVDYQSAAMSWVSRLEPDDLGKLTDSDICDFEMRLSIRGVEFMDNVVPCILLCTKFIDRTEGPQREYLGGLLKVLKKVRDGLENETLKMKDFGEPPLEYDDEEEDERDGPGGPVWSPEEDLAN